MEASLDQTQARVLELRAAVAQGFLARHPSVVREVRLQEAAPSLADDGQWEERPAIVQYSTSDLVQLDQAPGAWAAEDVTAPLLAEGWRASHMQTTDIQDCRQVSRDGYSVAVCGDTGLPQFVLSVIGPAVELSSAQMAELMEVRAWDYEPKTVTGAEWAEGTTDGR